MSTEKLKDFHWHHITIGVFGHLFKQLSRILTLIISTTPFFVSMNTNVAKRTSSPPCRNQNLSIIPILYIYQSAFTQHTHTHIYIHDCLFQIYFGKNILMPWFHIKSSNQLVFLCLLDDNDAYNWRGTRRKRRKM